MVRPDGQCSGDGPQPECPEHTGCFGLTGHEGVELCFPSCRRYECAGTCDAANDCVPSYRQTHCNPECGSFCITPGENLGCPGIDDCVEDCEEDAAPLPCYNECVRRGLPGAQPAFQALLACRDQHCAHLERDSDDYDACVERECGQQSRECAAERI